MLRRLIRRLWHSPTFTTWANLGTQSLSFVIILPLVLTQLSNEEIAVYYLFVTFLGLNFIFNFGFQPTFVRLIGYASGGLSISEMADLRKTERDGEHEVALSQPLNRESLAKLCSTMRLLNRVLAVLTFALLGVLGTLAMIRPIGLLDHTSHAWIAWGIILLVSSIRIQTGGYYAFLTGSGHVALTQRWEALFNLGAILSLFVALLVVPGLLSLVAVHQVWMLLSAARNWRLAEWVSKGEFSKWSRSPFDKATLRLAWPASWRSGLGFIGSKATQQSLGIFFAQIGSGSAVASFLIGMRLIGALENFSMAPFYSKLPRLNQLRALSQNSKLDSLALAGIRSAHAVFTIGVLSLGMLGPFLLELIGSNAEFPSISIWYVLSVGFFFQRHGAMHLQHYSTTNHIVWHWASGLQGAVILLACLFLGSGENGLGFAYSILLGNLVYALYSAGRNYTSLSISPLAFEARSSLVPFLIIVIAGFLEWRLSASNLVSELIPTFLDWVMGIVRT